MPNQYTSKEHDPIKRFWLKVNKDGSIPAHCPELGQCWEWTGSLHWKGYGNLGWDGHNQKSHRVSWMITYGSIPNKLWVLHKCDNRKCVNPSHLFLGTHQDNMDDMKQKGRVKFAKGENNLSHKLSDAQVAEIRQKHANSDLPLHRRVKFLSNQFGVTTQQIRNIIRFKSR